MAEEQTTTEVSTTSPTTNDVQRDVHPITGGVKTGTQHPITGGTYQGKNNRRAVASGMDMSLSMTRNHKDPLAKYGKYGVTLSPYLDLEEERAKRQSTAEKWGHGLAKATVTMGGAIAENTLGMLVGIGEAAANWDETRFYDNSVGRLVDKANAYAQEALPNYYTKQEQHASGLSALGYANFWADKATNGLGYSLGSIASVYLTGGTGLFGGMGKIANLGKVSQAGLTAANVVHKGAQVAKAISTGAKISTGLRAAARAADIGLMMSYAESSVEAREVLNGTTERLSQEYAHAKGIEVKDIPKDVLTTLKDKAARAGNVTFGLNLAVLSATNLITFGAHLSPKFIPATKSPLSRLTLKGASTKVIDKLASDPRWLAIGRRYVAPAVKGGASEGFQEASQFAISTGAELEATDPEYAGDMFKAIMKGYGETYNTKEGFDNTLVGIVVGMLTGGMGSVQTAINKGMTAEDMQVQKAMEFLNSDEQLKTFIQRGQNANDIAKHVANMNSALREKQRDDNGKFTGKVGNHKAYSDAQFKALRAEILMHAQYGTMDTFLERLDMEKDKTEDEYFKDHGLDEEHKGKFDKNEMIEGVKRKAKALQEIYDNVESQFPTTEPTRGAARLFMSNEAKAAEAEQIADDGFYKQMLYENEAEIGNIDGRMDNIVRDINRLDPVQYEDPARDAKQGRKRTDRTVKSGGLSGISAQSINEAFMDPTVAGVLPIGEAIMPVPSEGVRAETIKAAEDVLNRAVQANPAKGPELIQKFRDLIELAKQRNKATGALNNLNSTPENREAYVAREKFKNEKIKQDTIDEKAREDIAETKTAEELRRGAGGFSQVSDAMAEEIKAEIRKREHAEAKIKQEAGMLSPTQLEEAIQQEEDPVRKSVFQKELREAKEAGRTKARTEAGAEVDLTDKEVDQGIVVEDGKKFMVDENGNKFRIDGAVSDLTEKSNEEIDQEMSDMVEEQGRIQREQNEAVEKELQKEDEARDKEQGIDNSIDMDNPGVGVVMNQGDFKLKGPAGKMHIVVNEAGQAEPGYVKFAEDLFIANGVTLNREPLFRPGLEGKTAKFEILDNGTTIAIKVGEDYIGHVRNDRPGISADYNTLLNTLQLGEAVMATITGRDFNNPNNMVNEQGERVEVSLKESFEKAGETPLVAIVRGRTETNEAGDRTIVKYLDYGQVDEEGNTIQFDDSTLNSNLYAQEKGEDVFKTGSAVILVKQPDGNHRALLTSARTIGQSLRATSEVKSLISNNDEGSISALQSILGLGPKFNVGRDGNGNNYILVQEAPGYPVQRMYSDQYVKSADSDVKFDIGEYDREGRFEKISDGDPQQTDFVRALIDSNIKKARFQIDKTKVNQPGEFISPLSETTYDSYLDYLSDPSFMTDPNDVGPIAVNFKAMDKTFGTFYHDIGITMEYTDTSVEQATEDTQEVIDEQLPEDPTPQEGPSIAEELLDYTQEEIAKLEDLQEAEIEVIEGDPIETEPLPVPDTQVSALDRIGNSRVFEELRDIATAKALQTIKTLTKRGRDIEASLLFGDPEVDTLEGETKGRDSMIAANFLRNSYSREGQPITDRDFEIILIEDIVPEGVDPVPPQGFPSKTAGNQQAGDYFREVYNNWYSTYDATGMEENRGMRTDVLDRLEEFGYTVREESGTQVIYADEGVVYQRIYSKGRLEENPFKKVSQKVKRLLGRIPVATDVKNTGVFGFDTFVPIADVYAALLGATYGSKNVTEMMEKLRKLPSSHPVGGVYDYIATFNESQKALLFYNFGSLSLTEFVIVDPSTVNEITLEDRGLRTYNANSQATVSAYKKKFIKEANSGMTVYDVETERDTTIYSVNKDTAASIKDNLKKLDQPQKYNQAELADTLADLLMDMGYTIAPSRTEARRRVRDVILNPDNKVSIRNILKGTQSQLAVLAGQLSVPGIKTKSIFDGENKTINTIINKFVAPFEAAPALSFNMAGKLVYPINARTEINNLASRISDGAQLTLVNGKDGFSAPGQVGMTIKLLSQTNRFSKPFKFQDLALLKGEKDKGYDELSQEDVMIVSMALFDNPQGVQNTSLIALTTQADRKRMTFHTFPKMTEAGLAASGLTGSVERLIKHEILLDFHRAYKAQLYIDTARKNGESLVEGYHTKEWFKRMNLPGLEYSPEVAQEIYEHLETDAPLRPETIQALEKQVDTYLASAAGEIKNAYPGLEGMLKSKLGSNFLTRYDNSLDVFLKQYVTTDILGKKFSNQLLRNGTTNWTKDGRTFIKRANLVSTPGGVLHIATDGTYGANPIFSTATVKDLVPEDTNFIAEKYGKLITDALLRNGAPQEAAEKAGAEAVVKYKNTNGTDAQAFISIEHYRKIKQGQGEWGDVDEQVYQEYMSEIPGLRRWDSARSPLVPMKPQYDTLNILDESLSDLLIPVSDKNSYMILTDQLASGRPILTDLLARMESRNEYRDMPKINVINTESATKLGQIRPYTINQQGANQFSDLHVINLDTRGLRFPQEIGVKDKTKTNLGKQPKKTQIANVDRNHQYTLNPGTTKATPVRGEKMLNIYHNSIERKVLNDLNALKEELGFVDDFFKSNPDQIVDSKFVVTLRNRLLDMAKDKGLPENVVEALRLEVDQAGNAMMGLPLSFPAFQNTFDNLLFSVFRKAVYQQKVNGIEMVQFAEFGGHEETGELSYLDVKGDGSLIHAEIEIGEDQLRALGIDLPVGVDLDTTNVSEESRRVIGYRIPNASKSFLVAFKIKRVIPSGHMTAVRVPAMLTTALGADFDIDKMFLMFPAQRKDGKGRIMPDYKSLAANPNQILDASFPAEVVDNIILDVFEAVATDPIHAHEILDPEGIEDINAALEAIGQGKEQRGDVDLFSPMTHIKAAYDNMLSQSLRGIYANSIAGRNIVTSTGQEITGPVTVLVDGKRLNAVKQNASFPDRFGIIRPTDHFLKQYLSAAVDSVKDPLQSAANDTAKTAPLTVYLLSIGATPQQIIKFLTHPHVRKITDAMQQKDVNNPKQAGYFGTNLKREDNTTANLNTSDDTNIKEIENTLIALYRGASALTSTYSAVAVDNIDGAGSIAAHQAFFDKIRAYKNEELEVYGGAEFIEGVLEGDLYRYEAAYYNAMNSAMEVATRGGMITNQLSVESFKDAIRDLTGKSFLSKEEHRDLNTIISHHILTKKGSPLQESGYLSKGTLETVHLFNPKYPSQNIIASLSAMQQLPNVANLSLIKALTPSETQYNAENRFFKLDFNNTLGKTVSEQNKLQREWERMLNRPETFGYDAVTTKQIQQFAKDLVTNSISTTGFFSSPVSMFATLPSSVMKDMGIGEYMAQETVKLQTTGSYLNELKSSFANDYGHYKIGKKYMFNGGKVESGVVQMVNGIPSNVLLPSQLTADTNKKKYNRIVATDSFGNAYVYQRVETEGTFGVRSDGQFNASYHRVSTKGRQGMLNEAGNSESILFPKPGARPDTIAPLQNNAQQSRDLDKIGGEEKDSKRKIKKLKAAFADAGIDVIVEEGSLPKGVKGQVEGDVVTFDPSQMTDDTAYHEFGHIIVDMLPKDQVQSYINQVKKARPDLAAMVERAYAEQGLSEYEIGKEILVTAIGIEGAKLETNKPSLFRRIINKLMRAIGKLFGVQPDAAVVLAEKMFAGELQDLSLSGVFNEKVQRSRDLQAEVNTLYKNASISIQGEIRELEMVPDNLKDQSQIRRLKELQKNIKRLTENRNDLTAFMKIQEYVVLNVDRAKIMMGNLKELSQSDKKVGKEEALKVMRQVASVKRILDGVNGGGTLVKQTSSLLREVIGEEDVQQQKKDILVDLQNAMLDAELLDQEYIKVAIPLVVDSLRNYGTEEVNVELDNIIAVTKKTRSIVGIDKRDPEYSLIKVKEGRGELNAEEYIDALVDLKIQQLSNKKLGRKELIQELTNAHVDKSAYSFYMDPLVYSSEQNLQLFALALNDQITKANEQSRKTIFKFQKVYDTFRAFKGGGFNVEQFNGEFLEENLDKRSGENILYLVQQYDVKRFYQDRANAEKTFQEENGWPKDANGKFVERRSEEFQNWAYSGLTKEGKKKGSSEARKYYTDRAAWYTENTQPIKDAQKIYSEGQQRIKEIILKINDIADSELASDQDRVSVLRSELTDLMNEARWNKSNQTFSGKLAEPSNKYKNSKYEAIQASPQKKAYYDELIRQYHADQARGTRSSLFVNAWDKFSYQMPAIRKDDVDRAQEQGLFSAAKDQISESLTRQATDTEYGEFQQITGEVQKGIPILYTNKVPAKNVSRDIAASLMQFHHMTNMFEAKSEAQGLVLTMLDIHERREVLMTDPQTGSRITNKLASAAGISEVYKTGKGKDSNTFKHLQSFVDANFYGMYDIPTYIKGLGEANKIASSLSVLTALNTLSFNSLQAGNQAILDNLMTWEEAWAGQFFSRSNWRSAIATYASSGGAVADLGKMAATSKLGQAMTMFDALVTVTDGTGKNITGGKAKQAASKDSFFVLQHAVEHQTSGVRMLALMKAMKGKLKDKNGKVITNEKGEPADLWELLVKDKDGMLQVDPKVANFDQGKFVAKLRSVQKRTNQIKGRFDKSHFQRSALGKIMTLFRNYFQPQLRKRFGHGDGYHVDQEAGTVTRGMYLSFFEYLKNMVTKGQFSTSEYSEVDQQNIRRSLFEASVIAATYAIGSMLAGMMDDDEDNYALNYFAYQAKRLQTELLQFVNPKEALRIVDSPTATMNLVTKWTSLFDQGASEIGWSLGIVDEKDIFYQRDTSTAEKGDRKIIHKIKRTLPIVDGIMSTMSPEEKIKFLQK